MGKLIAILAVGSLLGSEAVSEVDKRGLYWTAPDHNHTEIPEGDVGTYSRSIVDSGAAATAATGTTDFLKSLGAPLLIVK